MSLPIVGLAGTIAANIILWLSAAASGIVGRVLVGIGFGAITVLGVGLAVDQALSISLNAISSSGGAVAGFISDIGITWFIATLFSAVSTRLVLRGLTSAGGLSFWALRRTIQS